MGGSVEAYYDELHHLERRGHIKGRKDAFEEINKILEDESLSIIEYVVIISDLVYKELNK